MLDEEKAGVRSAPSPCFGVPPREDCERRGMLSKGMSIVSVRASRRGCSPRREKSAGEGFGDLGECNDIELSGRNGI